MGSLNALADLPLEQEQGPPAAAITSRNYARAHMRTILSARPMG